MPETFTEALPAVALNVGVPALILFWYTCRVRHPARPRWRAFLMGLAALIGVTAATLAGLHYFITVRDGSPFMLVPVMLSYPMRQPASLPSCHTSGPTGPGPLAARPDHSPGSRSLVSLLV